MAYSGNLIDLDDQQPMETATNANRGVESNLFNGTITIVREKCKTLILKLTSPNRTFPIIGQLIKPEEDIDRIIDELGDDLTRHVIDSVNGIRDEVKKARPSEDEPAYQDKIEIYKNLLEYVTNLIKELTNVFNESLTNYRLRVEQLWDDLRSTSDWTLINHFIQQFENESELLFDDAIQKYLNPHLSSIESKLSCMKK